MRVLNIFVFIVTTNLHKNEVWIGIYKLYMRVLNIFVFIVTIKQQRREVWRDIVFSFMQENGYSYICPFVICWVNSPPANEG